MQTGELKKIPHCAQIALCQQITQKLKIMKTLFPLRFTILLLTVVITSHLLAQNTSGNELAIVSTKANSTVHATSNKDVNKSLNTLNAKVQHSFTNYFKDATDASWDMLGKEFLISFNTGGMHTRALFSKSGSLLYALQYGSEKDLPKGIDQQVRSTYYNYQIMNTIQVNTGQHHVWIVYLKDNASYIVLKIEEDEMEVMQQ